MQYLGRRLVAEIIPGHYMQEKIWTQEILISLSYCRPSILNKREHKYIYYYGYQEIC